MTNKYSRTGKPGELESNANLPGLGPHKGRKGAKPVFDGSEFYQEPGKDPYCGNCGRYAVVNGGCFKCTNCNYSEGCS